MDTEKPTASYQFSQVSKEIRYKAEVNVKLTRLHYDRPEYEILESKAFCREIVCRESKFSEIYAAWLIEDVVEFFEKHGIGKLETLCRAIVGLGEDVLGDGTCKADVGPLYDVALDVLNGNVKNKQT